MGHHITRHDADVIVELRRTESESRKRLQSADALLMHANALIARALERIDASGSMLSRRRRQLAEETGRRR